MQLSDVPRVGRFEIEEVCTQHGVELPTAALHYPLLDPRVVSVVVGAATPDQVRQNVDRLDTRVPSALWKDLADRKLVFCAVPDAV